MDTEFIQELTYYPMLEIIQVSTDDGAWIIDYRAGYELNPLYELLFDRSITKIMHAGLGDISLFYTLTGRVLENVFDTQTAAAFMGPISQISYANLVHAVCGHTLSKTETRSDWSHRPLSPGQLKYALNDVAFLPQIYNCQCLQLQQRGRMEWALDEMRIVHDPQRYQPVDPDQAGVRIPGGKNLRPRNRHILTRLAAWRERRAIQLNFRPKRIVRDDVLLEAARTATTDPALIAALRWRKKGKPDQLDYELAGLVKEALASFDPTAVPPSPPNLAWDQQELTGVRQLLATYIKAQAEQLEIAPNYLAKTEHLEELVRLFRTGEQDQSLLLLGWRRQAIGLDLLDLLSGRAGLSIAPETCQVVLVRQP